MNYNNFTIKAQEALQKAISLAQSANQQIIEPTHLLKALLLVGENVTNFLFNKLSVNSRNLELALNREIESYPKVSGGDPMLSRESNAVMQKAADYASKMGDEYVSLEHLLLALLSEKSTATKTFANGYRRIAQGRESNQSIG